MKPLLVLRPEPGAGKTATKARALGLDTRVQPLFDVRPLTWALDPAQSYDGIIITSSNALKFNTEQLSSLLTIPALCVGEATAAAARVLGFNTVTAGDSDGAALAELAASRGHRHLLRLAGQPSSEMAHPDLRFDVKYVYETPALEWSDAQRLSWAQPSVALLHSPRAARRFAELAPDKALIDIVAISEKAAVAAGPGWASICWPTTPTDDAMLEMAAPLCRAV